MYTPLPPLPPNPSSSLTACSYKSTEPWLKECQLTVNTLMQYVKELEERVRHLEKERKTPDNPFHP